MIAILKLILCFAACDAIGTAFAYEADLDMIERLVAATVGVVMLFAFGREYNGPERRHWRGMGL
jgi:hypothetical protein